jgi:hypothetical protein
VFWFSPTQWHTARMSRSPSRDTAPDSASRRRSRAADTKSAAAAAIQKKTSTLAQSSPLRSGYSPSEPVELQRLSRGGDDVDEEDDQREIDGLLGYQKKKSPSLSQKDKHAIALLIVLCSYPSF